MWLAIPIFLWDVSIDDAGLVAAGDTLQWAWSASPAAGPTPSVPGWSTVPNGQYLHDADDSLVVALPDLSGATRPMLRIEHWYAVASGDRAVVELDSGSGFVEIIPVGGYPTIDGFVGVSSAWGSSAFQLPPTNGASIRLRLVADAAVADAGWYVRAIEVVDGDISPPVITLVSQPTDTQELDGPYEVVVDVDDDVAVAAVSLHAAVEGVDLGPIPMTRSGVNTFTGMIDGPVAPSSVVSWHVVASDDEQSSRFPASGESSFRVFLAAPTGLRVDGLGPHPVADEIQLFWDAPVSPHPVVGYEITEVGEEVIESATNALDLTLEPGTSQQFEVRAQFAEGLGDPSALLQLHVEVPQLLSLSPSERFAGETGWVRVVGESLYMHASSTFDFGEGTEVLDVSVRDVNQASVLVSVGTDATRGPRAVQVDGFEYAERFSVGDPGAAPQIASIRPSVLIQGSEASVVVLATHPFGPQALVEAGTDIVLTAPPQVDGNTLTLPLAVSTRALTGERTILVDDGERLWTVPITVGEYRAPPQRNCSSLAAPGVGSMGMGAVIRRRPAP